MDKYKKAYAFLLGEVDKALTLLDTDNPLEFEHVREILLHAVQNVEEMFLSDENY